MKRLLRIGYFNIRGFNNFNLDELQEDFVKPNLYRFDTLPNLKDKALLDVRNILEWKTLGIL